MSLKELQSEIISEHKTKFDALVKIAYEADKFQWNDIYELATKKASGYKMMIDYMESDANPINKQP